MSDDPSSANKWKRKLEFSFNYRIFHVRPLVFGVKEKAKRTLRLKKKKEHYLDELNKRILNPKAKQNIILLFAKITYKATTFYTFSNSSWPSKSTPCRLYYAAILSCDKLPWLGFVSALVKNLWISGMIRFISAVYLNIFVRRVHINEMNWEREKETAQQPKSEIHNVPWFLVQLIKLLQYK